MTLVVQGFNLRHDYKHQAFRWPLRSGFALNRFYMGLQDHVSIKREKQHKFTQLFLH